MTQRLLLYVETLSTSLEVHSKNIEIHIESTTGVISYVFSSNNFTKSEEIQFSLKQDAMLLTIQTELENMLGKEQVEANEITVDDEIVSYFEFSILADDAKSHLVQADYQITFKLEGDGFFDVSTSSSHITRAPSFTFLTTSIPTNAPSITGFCSGGSFIKTKY